ncbi:hypothetical protein MMC24_003786 [Lignoscripta atroalba]|nr:hypothetical protein [Lignoscripta atroalba]
MATVVQQPGMASNMEPMSAPTSFTARRSAASNLPNFELPPPQLSQKYPPLTAINASHPGPANVSVGNLLTPPSNIPGDSLSPVSSGSMSGTNTAANQGLPPYTPTGYWPPPATGTTPFGFGSGTTPQPWGQGSFNLLPPRGMFSPSLGSLMRNSAGSPTGTEGLPPPPYDLNQLPPFSTSMSMSTPGSLPALIAQQQQAMANNYMNSQTPVSAATTQPSPVNATEAYMQRPPPTPTYYSGSQPSSTPQQSQFPTFTAPSPVQQSPMSAGAPGSRISPISGHPSSLQPSPQPLHHFSRPFNNGYSLPAMTGPIMSNVHSPGAQLSLVGGLPGGMMPGFNSGHAAQMHQMYGNQQQTPHNDRPFKCDQCPQSFNRNHDLKRHKRIHLAVKPFPCGHCEKSFSRKDALKRHILVKGCGKAQAPGSSRKAESLSPVAKSEAISSDNDESPTLDGHA